MSGIVTDDFAEINPYMIDSLIEEYVLELNRAIEYLVDNVKNNVKICQDQKSFKAFSFIQELSRYTIYRERPNHMNVFMEKNFYLVLLNTTLELVKYFDDSKIGDDKSDTIFTKTPDNIKILLDDSQDILNTCVAANIKFRFDFFNSGGAKALFGLLVNKEFVESFNLESSFSTIIMNINWLSKDADQFKNEWLELNAASIILPIARDYPNCKLPGYMAFANIANDKQIENMKDMPIVIAELVKYTKRAAEQITLHGHNLKRNSQQFLEDTQKQYSVYYVKADGYNVTYSITGILLGLYQLSVNNTTKYDLFVKYNLKEYLKIIILNGVEIEQKYSIQVLAQLCFDPQVLDIVSNDKELNSYIEFMTKPENCQMKTMIKLCEQITWEIHMKNKKSDDIASKQITEIREQKKVMISYNSASRDICLKIKDELEKQNFKVWIDVNEIHGSSLEAMARAVESSDFILMCVTEKYRQSVNCQAEAQYSFKLKKKIIPLILQKGLENVDGWLGIILGDKIFINFIKYPFEKCLELIFKEINLSINQSNKDSDKMKSINFNEPTKTSVSHSYSKPDTKVPEVKVKDAKSMNEKEVDEWLTVKNVPDQIRNLLRPCNGEVLHQLFKMRNSAPEFYFQSISKNSNVELKAILLFSLELEKLFEI